MVSPMKRDEKRIKKLKKLGKIEVLKNDKRLNGILSSSGKRN